MRRLIFQLLLLLGAGGLVTIIAAWWVLRQPYPDDFYTKFTTPPAASLILGTSRASQGVLPAILRARLGSHYTGPWLNYAFTLYHSPYGPAYLASVKRKLAPGTRNGLFVLAVDPWALSLDGPRQPHEPNSFREDQDVIGKMRTVSQKPNLYYLTHFLANPFYRALLPTKNRAIEHLHTDGWLEIMLPSPLADTLKWKRNKAIKLAVYQRLATTYYLSPARLASLRQLITFLKPHGRVVLVRVPTGPAMTALETTYQPGFDQLMRQTADSLGVPYLNYAGQPYLTTDGNHLWRGAAREFSQRLAADIALIK